MYKSKCIFCGEEFINAINTPVSICEDCKQSREYFCNKCGQTISYDEYMSNFEGYCEDCWEEEYDGYEQI